MRSPAVYGWAEMLVRKKDPATVPRAAFEVLDSAEQAVELINDLLDLSRLDEDRLRPVIRAVDPAAVARRAIEPRDARSRERKAVLQLEASRRLPTCLTDAIRVEQILVNLLNNAIRHAPDGRRHPCRSGPGATDSCVYGSRTRARASSRDELERIFDIY